jgi:hypothetical protein
VTGAAGDAVIALLARDPAGHASLNDPGAVAVLLRELRAAGARRRGHRPGHPAAAQASLDDPLAIARLLEELRAAGADDAVTALLAATPPATPASTTWGRRLAAAGAARGRGPATRSPPWPPGPPTQACSVFLEVCPDEASSYPFGCEPDGAPSQTWNGQESAS